MMQLDIAKAFDSLSHGTICEALLQAGVPGVVVGAIIREIRATRLKVRLPGSSETAPEVRMRNGIRQ
eukprot:13860789-Alexandrium_andersonii.AAC.1